MFKPFDSVFRVKRLIGYRTRTKKAFSVLMRSDKQSLMMDCRGSPIRDSLFMKFENHPTWQIHVDAARHETSRVALSQSRNSPMSSPWSKRRSSSSAVIVAFCFVISCPASRQLLTPVVVSLPLKQISRPGGARWRRPLFPMSRV